MIELIRVPVIIPGEPLSRANISLDYKLKNVPAEKINNPKLREKKKRWDATNSYKDLVVYTLMDYKNANRFQTIRLPYMVFVHLMLVFSFKKSNRPAELRKDLDNCEKLIWDALEASKLIEDDSQVCHKIVHKAVSPDKPRLEIYSIAASQDPANIPNWIRERASFLQTNRIYGKSEKPLNIV